MNDRHITLKRKNNQLIPLQYLYQNAEACQPKTCKLQDSKRLSNTLQLEAYKIIYFHCHSNKAAHATLLSSIKCRNFFATCRGCKPEMSDSESEKTTLYTRAGPVDNDPF